MVALEKCAGSEKSSNKSRLKTITVISQGYQSSFCVFLDDSLWDWREFLFRSLFPALTGHPAFWYPCVPFTTLHLRGNAWSSVLLNCLLVASSSALSQDFFSLLVLPPQNTGLEGISWAPIHLLLVDSLSFCVQADEFNSFQSDTSGSGIYGASQSKTHPHNMTVRATLKHLPSSGVN